MDNGCQHAGLEEWFLDGGNTTNDQWHRLLPVDCAVK
jgi:hypothetical protein